MADETTTQRIAVQINAALETPLTGAAGAAGAGISFCCSSILVLSYVD